MNGEIETEQEYWRPINMDAFRYSYEMSNLGRVRSKPYSVFVNGEVKEVEARVLKEVGDVKQVYLNGEYSGDYRIKTLYKHTFPKNKLKAD